MADLKSELHRKLQLARAGLLSKLDGLGEYDLRRPLTPSGTNLLGLVKHLASMEYGYLGTTFGRPPPETLAWEEDGSIWDGADMWATPDQSSEYLVGLYRRACAHGDATLAELDLDAPGRVPHWPDERADTTLGVILIRMLAETAQHAGHADIVRELIDGAGGPDHDDLGDEEVWSDYLARIQAAADAFAPRTA
ncbi:DinB family protein [Jiangella muralis]|uniref:DinB family protein n=1 Tax=Jiangella muralis TaxID=702383 RepID=UPI00069FB686|nr:DinB family protein [Jiangella muralis]